MVCTVTVYGTVSSVGIATGYGLDGAGIESQWRVRFTAPVQICPGAHRASCTIGTGSFPGVKSGRGLTLTPRPVLVPWPTKSRAITLLPLWGRTACTEPQCLYSTAIPLLPLWAVRPVQSLSACTRVHCTFVPGGKRRVLKCYYIRGQNRDSGWAFVNTVMNLHVP